MKTISAPANPWEDPTTVSFVEKLPDKVVQPDEAVRFYILSAAKPFP